MSHGIAEQYYFVEFHPNRCGISPKECAKGFLEVVSANKDIFEFAYVGVIEWRTNGHLWKDLSDVLLATIFAVFANTLRDLRLPPISSESAGQLLRDERPKINLEVIEQFLARALVVHRN